MKNLVQRTGATYDATINGTLTLANPLIKCKTTKCMDFVPAAPNYLSLTSPISGLTNFTIIMWMNYDAGASMPWSEAAVGSPNLYIGGGPPFYFQTTIGGVSVARRVSSPVNTTLMYAQTYQTGNLLITYRDGKFEQRVTVGANPVAPTFYIGQYTGGVGRYDGRLDNMLFYNVALDASQISSIYRSANPRL